MAISRPTEVPVSGVLSVRISFPSKPKEDDTAYTKTVAGPLRVLSIGKDAAPVDFNIDWLNAQGWMRNGNGPAYTWLSELPVGAVVFVRGVLAPAPRYDKKTSTNGAIWQLTVLAGSRELPAGLVVVSPAMVSQADFV